LRVRTLDEVVTVVLSVLNNFPAIKVAVVYGSASRNSLGDHSDVDVAVGAGRPLSFEEKNLLQSRLMMGLEREVDLLDLEKLEGLLWEFLWTEGKFILWDHDLVVKYAGKAQAFVEDVKPNLMKMIDDRLERAFGPL
jgi:predicted nucleotidyltransferase